MPDAVETVVLDVRGKIAEQVAALQGDATWREIKRLHAVLNALEEFLSAPKTDLVTVLGLGASDQPKIKPYEFAGIPPLEAAKQYLRKIAPQQKAASLDEIIAALDFGNLKANRDDLRTSLSRSTVEIYKAGEDIYGLVENFPHIKRGSPGRKKTASAAAVEDVMKTNAPISFSKAVQIADAQANADEEKDVAK
jgi:hypothetical protein